MSTQERTEESPPADYYQEKASGPFENETELKPEAESDNEDIRDLFVPLPPLKGVQEEESILTFRSVAVGVVLGTLVNASNVYLGKLVSASSARSPALADDWDFHTNVRRWCFDSQCRC